MVAIQKRSAQKSGPHQEERSFFPAVEADQGQRPYDEGQHSGRSFHESMELRVALPTQLSHQQEREEEQDESGAVTRLPLSWRILEKHPSHRSPEGVYAPYLVIGRTGKFP